MNGLIVLIVCLTALCFNGCNGCVRCNGCDGCSKCLYSYTQKGQDLTLQCATNNNATWRRYVYGTSCSEPPTTTVVGFNLTYTVESVSESNLKQGYGCDQVNVVFIIVPINAIDKKPVIRDQGNGSYTCNVSGTGFGQLLIDWTVNGNKVSSQVTNTTSGSFTSAQSTLVLNRTQSDFAMTVSCTAYFSYNTTNSSTSDPIIKGSTTSTVTRASVPPTPSPEHTAATSSTLLLHTSTPSLEPTPSTSLIYSTPNTNTFVGTHLTSSILVGVIVALALIFVVVGFVFVTVLVALKYRKRSRNCCNNKWWDSTEEIPPSAFHSCLPTYQRQDGVLPTYSNSLSPTNSTPPVPSESNYDVVTLPTQVIKEDMDPVYAHLKHQMPKPLPQVEIYSQLKPDHRSSHSSLRSASSSNSHTHMLPPHVQQQQRVGHCHSCHSSHSLCHHSPGHASYNEHHHRASGSSCDGCELGRHACCDESGTHHACCDEYQGSCVAFVQTNVESSHCCSSSHNCRSCPNNRMSHTRSGSLFSNEEEQTPVASSWPAEHPTSPLHITRPDHLPLVKRDVIKNINVASALPPHVNVKTATSHLVPLQPQQKKRRTKSLSTITEMPTPMPTPSDPQLQLQLLPDERTPTPMPPLHARGLQAAFSTHDIPAIVLTNGTPDTALNKPFPAPSVPNQLTNVTHNSRVGMRTLTSTPPTVELQSKARSISNLELDPTAGRPQGRRPAKELWVLQKSSASFSCDVTASMRKKDAIGSRDTYSLPHSIYSQGITARSDSGYEGTFDFRPTTLQKAHSMRLPDKSSTETLV